MSITIRPITTLEQCDHFQKVEQIVWGSDDEGLVPVHVLITLAHNGGLVMGAYAEDGPAETGGMVGIVAGWLGTAVPPGETQPRLKFCSHMAGVLPQWQRRHVGLRLKRAQLEWVRAQGQTEWITWTYDPLYRANGLFNIHRLGATCRTYICDLYGEMTDALNTGGPSDRYQVDWQINSARVRECMAVAERIEAGEANGASSRPAALRFPGLHVLATRAIGRERRPATETARWNGAPVAVPIPEDIAALRRHDRSLALEWRYYLRELSQAGFAAGYAVVDCVHIPDGDWCYVFVPATGIA